jgi:hypothetical protein
MLWSFVAVHGDLDDRIDDSWSRSGDSACCRRYRVGSHGAVDRSTVFVVAVDHCGRRRRRRRYWPLSSFLLMMKKTSGCKSPEVLGALSSILEVLSLVLQSLVAIVELVLMLMMVFPLAVDGNGRPPLSSIVLTVVQSIDR